MPECGYATRRREGAVVPDTVGIVVERWMLEKQGIEQELLRRTTRPPGVLAAEIVPTTMSAAQVVEGNGAAGHGIRGVPRLRVAAGVMRRAVEVSRIGHL